MPLNLIEDLEEDKRMFKELERELKFLHHNEELNEV